MAGVMDARVMLSVAMVAALVLPAASQVVFPGDFGCLDTNPRCPSLSIAGSCATDPTYMANACRFSCNLCERGPTTTNKPNPTTTTTVTTTTTTPSVANRAPAAASSTTQRRSIVNPDFECGGAHIPSRLRRRRQAEDPQVGAANDTEGEVLEFHPYCGASVISDQFLVTAASCIDIENPISAVRLGDLDIATEGEANSAPQDYDIEEIFIFPGFSIDSPVLYHDIALLKTDRKIQFNDAVFPYCISSTPPAAGTTVIAAGFGLYNETAKSTHLLEGELQVMPVAQCEEQYLAREEGRLRTAYPDLLQVPNGLMCAGSDQSGVCRGDEGGPLFREDPSGRRYLEGITSFTGSRCTEGQLPGVFTAVADYVPFIDKAIYGLP